MPVFFGPAAWFPLGSVHFDHPFAGLAKGRCFAGAGVAAFFDGLAVSESPSAGFCEGDCRVAAQPEVGFLSVDPDSLYPGSGQPPFDFGRFDSSGSARGLLDRRRSDPAGLLS